MGDKNTEELAVIKHELEEKEKLFADVKDAHSKTLKVMEEKEFEISNLKHEKRDLEETVSDLQNFDDKKDDEFEQRLGEKELQLAETIKQSQSAFVKEINVFREMVEGKEKDLENLKHELLEKENLVDKLKQDHNEKITEHVNKLYEKNRECDKTREEIETQKSECSKTDERFN